jgi:hypothetical protein
MASKILEQRKRLQTLKQTKDDELEREKLLMDLAKKGVEEVVHSNPAVQSLVTVKRKSMVDAAAFAQRSASTDTAAQMGHVHDQVWIDHDREGFVAFRIQQRGLTSISIAAVDPIATSSYETLTLPMRDFDALYRVTQFDPEQTTDVSTLGEFVSEPLILAILRERHQRNLVFTAVSEVLISINPFADVQLYSAGSLRITSARAHKTCRRTRSDWHRTLFVNWCSSEMLRTLSYVVSKALARQKRPRF